MQGPLSELTRTRPPRDSRLREALMNPIAVIRELNDRHLYNFLQHFWQNVSPHPFQPNWHIEYICNELEQVAYRVANREPSPYDMVINVPPGSTKTLTVSVMFPAWCWTKWPWMRIITASYANALSLESADYCRNLIKSEEFQQIYPLINIRDDKDSKSNYGITTKETTMLGGRMREKIGGGRYSTSVGAAWMMGFHGDMLIVDDPLNPEQAASDVELAKANRWMEQTLSTRKTDKAVTPTILIMQRLHMEDPTGSLLEKQRDHIKHICFPGEIRNFRGFVNPPEVIDYYKDDLLDPVRMPWDVLKKMEARLGQYGYAGQIGQNPTPPGGGMFKVDNMVIWEQMPDYNNILSTVRYWDKAGTEGAGDYTVGIRMSSIAGGKWIIEDMRRGRWGSSEREKVIRETAERDGVRVVVWLEQEAGSGGKESVEGTIRNLAGYVVRAERPTGDKSYRADPFSVQVNNGNVILLKGEWNQPFKSELRYFPFGTHDDIVDASSGAFGRLVEKKVARRIT